MYKVERRVHVGPHTKLQSNLRCWPRLHKHKSLDNKVWVDSLHPASPPRLDLESSVQYHSLDEFWRVNWGRNRRRRVVTYLRPYKVPVKDTRSPQEHNPLGTRGGIQGPHSPQSGPGIRQSPPNSRDCSSSLYPQFCQMVNLIIATAFMSE